MADDNIIKLKKNILESFFRIKYKFYIYGGTALERYGILPEGSSFDIDAYVDTDKSSSEDIIKKLKERFEEKLDYIML